MCFPIFVWIKPKNLSLVPAHKTIFLLAWGMRDSQISWMNELNPIISFAWRALQHDGVSQHAQPRLEWSWNKSDKWSRGLAFLSGGIWVFPEVSMTKRVLKERAGERSAADESFDQFVWTCWRELEAAQSPPIPRCVRASWQGLDVARPGAIRHTLPHQMRSKMPTSDGFQHCLHRNQKKTFNMKF